MKELNIYYVFKAILVWTQNKSYEVKKIKQQQHSKANKNKTKK